MSIDAYIQTQTYVNKRKKGQRWRTQLQLARQAPRLSHVRLHGGHRHELPHGGPLARVLAQHAACTRLQQQVHGRSEIKRAGGSSLRWVKQAAFIKMLNPGQCMGEGCGRSVWTVGPCTGKQVAQQLKGQAAPKHKGGEKLTAVATYKTRPPNQESQTKQGDASQKASQGPHASKQTHLRMMSCQSSEKPAGKGATPDFLILWIRPCCGQDKWQAGPMEKQSL